MKQSDLHNISKKKAGFEGQKAVVIPRKILNEQFAKNEITGSLYISDIGYYPKAKYHFIERSHGSGQHILIYCIEGKGEAIINKSRFNIKPGNFIVIPMQTPHSYGADERDPWTIYWMHFKGSIGNALIAMMKDRFTGFIGYIKYSEERIKIFENIYKHLERGYSNENIVYANMCLWQYFSTFLFPDKSLESLVHSGEDITDIAIDFMRKHIDQMVTLDEIAESVKLSPSHFSFLFKKKTGYPPIEYFNHLKVQKACQYLLFTNLRIKEIAYKLGIADAYYFSRHFTSIMGVPPKAYREKRIQ